MDRIDWVRIGLASGTKLTRNLQHGTKDDGICGWMMGYEDG